MKFSILREKCRAWKPKLQALAADKKKAVIVVLCLFAAVCLVVSEWTTDRPKTETETKPSGADYAAQLEARLGDLLSRVDGAGKTQVLITLRSDAETVFARDDRLDAEEGRTQSEQTYVTLRDGSRDAGLPLKTLSPQILGVAVVCEGADVPRVRQAVTETVTAVLGVSAAHVSVVKMQTERKDSP